MLLITILKIRMQHMIISEPEIIFYTDTSPNKTSIVQRRYVNPEEHGPKVGTVRHRPFSLVGQDSTKSMSLQRSVRQQALWELKCTFTVFCILKRILCLDSSKTQKGKCGFICKFKHRERVKDLYTMYNISDKSLFLQAILCIRKCKSIRKPVSREPCQQDNSLVQLMSSSR